MGRGSPGCLAILGYLKPPSAARGKPMAEWPCTCTPPGVITWGPGCPRHDTLEDVPWSDRDEQEMERRWPGWRTSDLYSTTTEKE